MEIVIIGAAKINNSDLLNRVVSTRACSILVEVSSRWNYKRERAVPHSESVIIEVFLVTVEIPKLFRRESIFTGVTCFYGREYAFIFGHPVRNGSSRDEKALKVAMKQVPRF